MARPLRILVVGGWYQVTNRGHRRSDLYRTDTERQRFLGLVAQMKTVKYPAAAQAIKRFGLALENDAVRRQFVADLKRTLSNI
jgi:hypothetical protein